MRLSGHAITDLPPEQIASSPLAEITLSVSPEELRAMAKRFDGSPHVVVMRA